MKLRFKKQRSPINGALMAGIGTGLVLGALSWRRRRQRISFRDKVVVITGGSRGLGLQLARLLADEGAKLAILARNEPELEIAYEQLVAQGAWVMSVPCDVGKREEVERAIRRVIDHYGRIDVLINNAGVIQVGPLENMRIEDFENAMDVHFWGPLYAMWNVIPIFKRIGGGRIVNIASIGGQVAVPHLAPYAASKFALVGLSDAFRAELARDEIIVSTICPGLMRTGSYYHANFKGQNEKEFTWFSLMSATPVTAMDDRRAAKQILEQARYGVPKRTLTLQARLMAVAEEVAPNLVANIMKLVSRLMPHPDRVSGDELRTGFESRSNLAPSWITQMSDKAAERNNEMIAEKVLNKEAAPAVAQRSF